MVPSHTTYIAIDCLIETYMSFVFSHNLAAIEHVEPPGCDNNNIHDRHGSLLDGLNIVTIECSVLLLQNEVSHNASVHMCATYLYLTCLIL